MTIKPLVDAGQTSGEESLAAWADRHYLACVVSVRSNVEKAFLQYVLEHPEENFPVERMVDALWQGIERPSRVRLTAPSETSCAPVDPSSPDHPLENSK